MNVIKEGWFSEINDLWPGISQSLQIEKLLYIGQSKYQHIMVLQSKSHGRVLILDGIIQCTERDEFAYQEMISFLPLCCHTNPKTVLIVGGGDGGVAREVAKYSSIEQIFQIEIDDKVVEVSKNFLPFMAEGLTNPKVNLYIGDGFEFMKQHINQFDIIITDSSDPIGPAISLFQETYFSLMKRALKHNGIVCSQAGTVWSNLDQVKQTLSHCRSVFPNTAYGISSVPTYPTGQIGYVLGSLDLETNFRNPRKVFSEEELNNMGLLYYSDRIHRACFQLPRFAEKELML